MNLENRNDVSILLSGEAGQGLQTLERILLRLFALSGFHVFSYSEVMSRIRGGNNSTEIRISTEPVSSYVSRIDIFIPLGTGAMNRFHDRISGDTVIIGDHGNIDSSYHDGNHRVIVLPIRETAAAVGGALYANIITMGILAGIFNLDQSLVESVLRTSFTKSADDVKLKNQDASRRGLAMGVDLSQKGMINAPGRPSPGADEELLVNGAEAVGLGALAGGCNFISSYPMSPSTEVLVFFARHAEALGIIVEQAEDEICAVNMAIGSWYAGGRAMVTTSGGGFALMVEAISLAGALESPLVVHLGQRPGPATGLPTRTEQGDLLFALFSGHGEFPRAIFAPGSITECFHLSQRAFHMADKYQIPVIIMTDQYLIESYSSVPAFTVAPGMDENLIVVTGESYQRYAIMLNGVSPRGIPGHGKGIVCLDSDEHDEGGYITEDFTVRREMVDKRLRKFDFMEEDLLPPVLYGPDTYEILIVCWGSTLNCILEALAESDRPDVSILHFPQVYPLHPSAAALIGKARKKIIIENNATSQFSALVKMKTGIDFDRKILKYNGMPFMVEEIIDVINAV